MSEYNRFPRCTNSRQRAGRPRQTANSNALSGFGPQGYPQAVGTSDPGPGAGRLCLANVPCHRPRSVRWDRPARRPPWPPGGPRRSGSGKPPRPHRRPSSRRCRCPEAANPRHMARCGGPAAPTRTWTTSARVSAVSLSHNRAGPASRVDRRGRRVSTRETVAIGRQRRERALNHQQRKGTIARAVTEFGQADHLAR